MLGMLGMQRKRKFARLNVACLAGLKWSRVDSAAAVSDLGARLAKKSQTRAGTIRSLAKVNISHSKWTESWKLNSS